MAEPDIDTDRIDEAVLALMHLTLHEVDDSLGYGRAWKGFDWAALDRLHEKGLIHDPVGKARSVGLTGEGLKRCEALYRALFARRG